MKNIYIIGFPKSGNTWLARLLANLLNGKLDDKYDSRHENDDYTVDSKICEYTIFKQHFAIKNRPTSDDIIIYIVRNPLDVFVSAFFFNHTYINKSSLKKYKSLQIYMNLYVRFLSICWIGSYWSSVKAIMLRLLDWLFGRQRQSVGSWGNHIRKYELAATHIVRYEDLQATPVHTLQGVVNSIGVSCSDDQIAMAVDAQSFDNKRKKFLQERDFKNTKFLRSGKAGNWKEFLTTSTIKKIQKRHTEEILRYGYYTELPTDVTND